MARATQTITIRNAPLPERYESAKTALAKCERTIYLEAERRIAVRFSQPDVVEHGTDIE